MRLVLLHLPARPRRWKSTTLGLDIQEEFDGIQLNFRSGLQAWASRRAVIAVDSTATFFRTNNIHTGHQASSNTGGEKRKKLSSFLIKILEYSKQYNPRNYRLN